MHSPSLQPLEQSALSSSGSPQESNHQTSPLRQTKDAWDPQASTQVPFLQTSNPGQSVSTVHWSLSWSEQPAVSKSSDVPIKIVATVKCLMVPPGPKLAQLHIAGTKNIWQENSRHFSVVLSIDKRSLFLVNPCLECNHFR
jgi:hypothetical protein